MSSLSEKKSRQTARPCMSEPREADECPVCLEELHLEEGDVATMPGCGHRLHAACLKQVRLRCAPNCLLCRRPDAGATDAREGRAYAAAAPNEYVALPSNATDDDGGPSAEDERWQSDVLMRCSASLVLGVCVWLGLVMLHELSFAML